MTLEAPENIQDNILVIKHGALGDIVLAMPCFQAIRAHHPDSHITIMTQTPFAGFLDSTGWFDAVHIDDRPGPCHIGAVLALRKWFGQGNFSRVYDLQTQSRTGWYYRLWPGHKPEWSGIARGCSHPHANPARDLMHTEQRQAEQLAVAGISPLPQTDLSWISDDISGFNLNQNFALIVPGGSAHRPGKRWPADHYRALMHRLVDAGIQPVLIGNGKAEADLIENIIADCPSAISLANKTNLTELAALARHATLAIGNDTGPMHLFAAAAPANCPCLVLFSDDSDPALCLPRGPSVKFLRQSVLADISVNKVCETMGIDSKNP